MDIDPHITINESYGDKKSNYCFKVFTIDSINKKFEGKIKTYPNKDINSKSLQLLLNGIKRKGFSNPQFEIFESANYIKDNRSWKQLKETLSYGDSKILRQNVLKISKWLLNDGHSTVPSMVFSQNPLTKKIPECDSKDDTITSNEWDFFLSILHKISTPLILLPDLQVTRYVYEPITSKSGKKYLKPILEYIVSVEEYLSFIDSTFEYLNSKNHKPVFVPLSFQWGPEAIVKIIKHYSHNGYTNIWIDFFTKPVGYEESGKANYIIQQINNYFKPNEKNKPPNTMIYFSHMRREHTLNMKNDKLNASDALSPFFGADIIGVNRNMARFVPQASDTPISKANSVDALIHKARVFDPNTYYYVKTPNYPYKLPVEETNIINNKGINNNLNAYILDTEFKNVDQFFLNYDKKKSVIDYLTKKPALTDEMNAIRDIATTKRGKQNTLMMFLENL